MTVQQTSPAVAAAEPEAPPPIYVDARAELAARFLFGEGLEIGGLNGPLEVPPHVRVRYLDRLPVEELRKHYPELDDKELAPVDIVDNGEVLTKIPDSSQDFIVANGFLEHCEDPIGTIGTHLRKVKPGGILFYAVPDKRYTFDFRRPVTPLEHMILDHEEGPERSRSAHYEEWTRLVPDDPQSEEWVASKARELEAAGYSIHTHVWTQAEFLDLILHCRQRFDDEFDIEAYVRRWFELVVVLRRRGEFPDPVPPPDATTRKAAPEAPQVNAVREATAIPLSALRPALDTGWPPAARWRSEARVDGVRRPALEQPFDAPVAFRVRLPVGARLRAWVSLSSTEWMPMRAARVRALLRDDRGRQRVVWSALVGGPLHPPGRRWTRVDAALGGVPGDEVDLVLTATPASRARKTAGGVLWADPTVHVAQPTELAPLPPATAAAAPLRFEPGHAESAAWAAPSDRPLFSVLTPVHDPDPAVLHETLASVRRQTFGAWEMCIADDGSTDPRVAEILSRNAAEDERIRVVRLERSGIATATNAALELATGDYIALLDHDDVLADDALETMAAAIADRPDADMLYSDEDLMQDDRRVWVYLKPDWSPDFFRSLMYSCHLGVYRRSLALAIGGFRPAFDFAQDYDFVLRLMEHTDRIVHVARVLYRWRVHPGSAAGDSEAKPHAYAVAVRAIADHLKRTGVDADVDFGAARGEYRVRHRVDPAVPAAVILPVIRAAPALLDRLERAAESWLAGTHPSWELVLAGPADALAACTRRLPPSVRKERLRTVEAEPDVGRAGLANRAARATEAEHLVLLEAPVEALTRDWLSRLAGFAAQPGVGAVGAKTVATDGRIEHCGIVMADGLPLPVLHGADAAEYGPLGMARVPGNLCAVSGTVATHSKTFERLGGLDEQLGELAEIDFCLRAREQGMRIVSAPDAIVRRATEAPPVNDIDELARFRRRWRERVTDDPYFNPGYWRHRADFVPGPNA